jgi:hypothetical protein
MKFVQRKGCLKSLTFMCWGVGEVRACIAGRENKEGQWPQCKKEFEITWSRHFALVTAVNKGKQGR